jgi:hypothetical protein
MLTTAGLIDLAIVRKVEASTGPVSGALFAGGTPAVTLCADEVGASSSFDAMTIPTAADATAMSTA